MMFLSPVKQVAGKAQQAGMEAYPSGRIVLSCPVLSCPVPYCTVY
jgi:hypothetical protein